MTYRIAFPMLALLVAGGCSGRDSTAPMSQTKNLSVSAASRDANDDGEDFPRAGTFHAHKNCDQYSGLAGGFCTLTESTLKQIPDGTEVVYASAATPTALSSDVMLVSPNPGNAHGHRNVLGRHGEVPTLQRECHHLVPEPEKLGLGRNVQLQSAGLSKIVQHLTFIEREVHLLGEHS